MIVYRLAKKKFCNDLSGRGAELAGGRWNNKGVAMLYTSQSRALCLAEIAVNLPIGIIPFDYHLVEILIPDSLKIPEIDYKKLKKDWNSFPHSSETQKLGDEFVFENKSLVLKVPSAVVQGDFNYLINPKHPEFQLVKINTTEVFSFDQRLFR
jgi:RES domain-containing protein